MKLPCVSSKDCTQTATHYTCKLLSGAFWQARHNTQRCTCTHTHTHTHTHTGRRESKNCCTDIACAPPSTGVLDKSVPQVLINREPLPHMTFDIQLLGYSDTIVGELCRRLGPEWVESVGVASDKDEVSFTSPEEHTHLFPGAVWIPKRADAGRTSDDAILNAQHTNHTTFEPSDSESLCNNHALNSEPVSEPHGKDITNPKSVSESRASSTCHNSDCDSPFSVSTVPPNTGGVAHNTDTPPTKRLKLHPDL